VFPSGKVIRHYYPFSGLHVCCARSELSYWTIRLKLSISVVGVKTIAKILYCGEAKHSAVYS